MSTKTSYQNVIDSEDYLISVIEQRIKDKNLTTEQLQMVLGILKFNNAYMRKWLQTLLYNE
jgi:hypothetical protein